MLVAGKQEIDSLRALLPHQTSAELVRSLNKLSTLLLLEYIQASGQYARQARSLALLLGDSEALAASCNRLGAYYLQKGVLDSAAQQYHEAVSCLDEDMDIQVSINALTGLAVVFQNPEKMIRPEYTTTRQGYWPKPTISLLTWLLYTMVWV